MRWRTAHVSKITWAPKEITESKQECAANGRKTERVPETPVRGKQTTQMKPRDEGNLGTVPRDQGGKEKIAKIRKKRKREVGRKDPTLEVVQIPQ